MYRLALVTLLLTSSLSFGQAATPPHDVTLTFVPTVSTQAVGYNVYRGQGTGTKVKINAALLTPRTVMSYVDLESATNALTEGATYTYVLRSVDGGGSESVDSASVSATIPFRPLLPPTGLTAVAH